MIASKASNEIFWQSLDVDIATTLGIANVTEGVTRLRWQDAPAYDELLWRYRREQAAREAREQEGRDAMYRAEAAAPTFCGRGRPSLMERVTPGLAWLAAVGGLAWGGLIVWRALGWN